MRAEKVVAAMAGIMMVLTGVMAFQLMAEGRYIMAGIEAVVSLSSLVICVIACHVDSENPL